MKNSTEVHPAATEWVVNVIDGPPEDCGEISVLRNDNAHGKKSYGWFGDRKILIYHQDHHCSRVWKLQLALARKIADEMNQDEKRRGFVPAPEPPAYKLSDNPDFVKWAREADLAMARAVYPKLFEVAGSVAPPFKPAPAPYKAKISRCPFCGGTAELKEDPGQAGLADRPPSVWVECRGCHTKGKEGWLMGTPSENLRTKDRVVRKWNSRKK